MAKIISRKWLHMPLTDEEWDQIKKYEQVPLQKKLELLDRMRSLMFSLWKENPSLRRDYERNRKLFR